MIILDHLVAVKKYVTPGLFHTIPAFLLTSMKSEELSGGKFLSTKCLRCLWHSNFIFLYVLEVFGGFFEVEGPKIEYNRFTIKSVKN